MKKPSLQKYINKYFIFLIILFSNSVCCYAQDTYTGNGNWNNAANWSAGIPTAATNVIINGTATINSAGAVCANITINAGATLTLQNDGLTVSGNWINNGTFNGGGPGGTDNNPTAENVTFTGAGATIGGTSITGFSGLTINPGAGNTVTLASTSMNSGTGQFYSGVITLQSGTFDVGAGHSINAVSQQGGSIISNGGNFKSYGPSGWTLNLGTGFGSTFNITGNVTLDNITPTNPSNNGYKIQNNTAGGLHINGYVTVKGPQSQGWAITGNPPIWGPASTLYRDNQNQGFSIGQGGDLSWVAMASGTIGVTPGYPNNVILTDMGSSTNTVGWDPTGPVSLNGTLQLGDGVTTGRATLNDVSSFSSGGIKLVDNNALAPANTELIAPPAGVNFIDNGNFTTDATSIFNTNAGTITFSGSGTQANPQVISSGAGTLPLGNLVVSNGTYVQLNNSVSVGGTATLTSGIIGTTATDSLLLNNAATNAITGNATSYVNGRLSWLIPATSTISYTFPVGAGSGATSTYLPLVLSPNTTVGGAVTVQAFNTGSGGTPGPTVTTLSPSEYWSIAASNPFTSGAAVTVTRPTPVGANNALAESSSPGGTYTAIGGTPGSPNANSISGGNIGNTTPVYVAMAIAPLSAVQISSTNITCNGTVGSMTVGGSGGTKPYSFSIDGGPFQGPEASATFINLTPGNHTVTVKDNTGTTASTTMKILGSLQINNNADTLTICAGSSGTLTAVNLLNTTPLYSWTATPAGASAGLPANAAIPGAANASISVTPTVPTTYVVTSQLYNNNLLVNPSFESGSAGYNTAANFQTDFTPPPAGTIPYQTTPGGDPTGYFTILGSSAAMCEWFTTNNVIGGPTITPEDGGLMMVCDGPANAPSRPWYETVTGLTIGNVYKFNYYYREADPNATYPVLQATINGVNLTGSTNPITVNTASATTYVPSSWQQATYTWTANSATALVAITDLTSGINGNDFVLDNIQFLAPCTVTDTITVVPGNAALAGTVTPATQTICSKGTPGSSLTLSGNTNPVVRWEYSTDKTFATGVTQVNNTTTTFTAAAIAALPLTATTYFRAVVNGCSPGSTLNTDSVVISVPPAPVISGTANVCAGNTTQLTGTVTASPSNPWTSASTAIATVNNTGLVTGLSAGNSLITYTNSTGCTDTLTVFVSAAPSVSGGLNVCVGNTTQLTGSATASAANPWQSLSPAVATVNNTGLVKGISGGASKIVYTNTNGCTDTVTVTVNGLPTISSALQNVCIGSTIQLTGSATAAVLNPWVSANTGVATVDNTGKVTGVSSGTSLITYTNTNSCIDTMTVTVNSPVTPTFTQVAAICTGGTLNALPTTSNNGITGTWSPALNNTATTTYTFMPTTGQCAGNASMTIVVNSGTVTPLFTQVAAICSDSALTALLTTSNNGITGGWSPALNNTATTTYSFAPDPGQCATSTTMTITVNPPVTPIFTAVNPVCSGTAIPALPTTSNNGITGSWSPALNNTATTTYTFAPAKGQCATNATLTINVNSSITPTFTQVAPICAGSTLTALPTTSNNGITGGWSPALNNAATTTYLFEPTMGQCAIPATMTITVNSIPAAPTVTAIQPSCSSASGSLTVTVPSSGVTYSFDNGNTFQPGATSSNLLPNTYQVVVQTIAGGCISAPTPITLNPQPTVPAAPTVSIVPPNCTTATGTITVTNALNGETFSFDNGATFQAASTSNSLASGTYQVIVQNTTGGCLSPATSATIIVQPTVPATPVATVTQPTCSVATGTITVTSPASGVQYSFDNGANFQSNATSGNLPAGNYQVIVQGIVGGCLSTATGATINPQPLVPAVPTVTSPLNYCENDTTAVPPLTATTTPGNTLNWYNASGPIGTVAPTPSTATGGSTTYYVTSFNGTCESPQAAIIVNVDPISAYAGGPVVEVNQGQTITLNGNAQGNNITITWTPSTYLSNTTTQDPMVESPLSDITYTMRVSSPDGCKASDTVQVLLLENLIIPNAFSPNGDGINDKWIITYLDEYPKATVSIFNRYGQMLYTATGAVYSSHPWDGTYNGSPVPVAAYYYIINLGDGKPPLAGSVSVIR